MIVTVLLSADHVWCEALPGCASEQHGVRHADIMFCCQYCGIVLNRQPVFHVQEYDRQQEEATLTDEEKRARQEKADADQAAMWESIGNVRVMSLASHFCTANSSAVQGDRHCLQSYAATCLSCVHMVVADVYLLGSLCCQPVSICSTCSLRFSQQ